MAYSAICIAVRSSLEQAPEDIGQSSDGSLDDHHNDKDNTRDEEEYHLREDQRI